MRIKICTITPFDDYDDEGRIPVYWDSEAQRLIVVDSCGDEEECEEVCRTKEEAIDTAWALWGVNGSGIFDLEWSEEVAGLCGSPCGADVHPPRQLQGRRYHG